MGVIADAFESVFRDFTADGVPSSGVNPPSKTAARALGSLIEQFSADAAGAVATGTGAWEPIFICTADAGDVTAATLWHSRTDSPTKLTGLRASLTTASSSGAVTIDFRAAGTSLLSSPLQIDEGDVSSVGSAAPVAIATADIADDTELEVVVTGAGTGAQGLKVYPIGYGTDFGESITPYFVASSPPTGNQHLVLTDLAMPTGFAAGDILIVQGFYWQGADPTTGPAPTANFQRPSGWNVLYNPIDEGSLRSAWFWRRADGTETTLTLTLDASVTGFEGAMITAWRGCVANGTPFEALAIAADDSIGAIITGAPVLTSGPNRLVATLLTGVGNGASSADAGWTNATVPYEDVVGFFYVDTQIAASAGAYAADERTCATGTEYPPSFASVSLAFLPS